MENKQKRSPIVVIMGHVDHGKTTLLDTIRKTRVVAGESGGITQHIAAYQAEYKDNKITFIDTPGHEAFFAMRGRGAQVADIAIIVVDASEGMKNQTKEAFQHATESGASLIVAFNKIDKPGADPEKVKLELLQEGIAVESVGGQIPSVNISAVKGDGVDELLETISIVAEVEDLKADFNKPAEGVVIESLMDKSRGSTATLLITSGKLKEGDIVGTESTYGKIKRIENFKGETVKELHASDPAIIPGSFNQVPKVGESFMVFSDSKEAEEFIALESEKTPEKRVPTKEQRIVNLIIKSDVQGSLEAVEYVLNSIPQEEVFLNIVKSEVGDIQEADVKAAKAGSAIILGFRVKVSQQIERVAERDEVVLIASDIIYELVEKVRELINQLFEPEKVRVDLGKLEVLATFLTKKNQQIIGGKVFDGDLEKNSLIEVIRNEEIVAKGKMIGLKRGQTETDKVTSGEECGIMYEGDGKIENGDVLNTYKIEKKKIQV
jgi:translation initiation factor IF-2